MTQSLTVFVVGAGASVDFGFPDGKKLQKRICEILRPGHSYEDGVHGCLVHNFEEIRARGMQVDQHFYKHCEWMAETIPLYPSIDSFLDKNSRPGDVTSFIGKLAIGHIIADHEANSDLAKQRGQAVNWEALSKTWMGRLWALANVGGSANKVENTLPDIAFVTFNYDRCIEQFLASAIAQTQNIKFDDALKSAANVPCEHVYGSLGVLGLQEVVSEFGSARHPANAGALVDRIKTFTEQIDSETSLRIDSLLKRATRIIFLGFSFGKINLHFLESMKDPDGRLKKIFGTAYRMSPEDCGRAQDWADTAFRKGHGGTHLQNLPAAEFFDQNYMLFQN